jgi:hypothetical protein
LKSVRPFGFAPTVPGLTSLVSAVPPAVPSLCQGSHPCSPSPAKNPKPPATGQKPNGREAATPGLMSRTSTVPASVPSVRQSSAPWAPSSALK